MTVCYTKIYTDGSCLKNPDGPGGWSYLVLEQNNKTYTAVCGGNESTTNNRMEMEAVIRALKDIDDIHVHVYSDSQYVIKCGQGIWKRKANLDLWNRYDKYSKSHNIIYTWVKGHSGNEYNEIVDKLAKQEAKNCEKIKS